MMLYRIVENEDKFELGNEVAHWVKKGWKLQGGVAVTVSSLGPHFYQAIILE